MIKQVIRSGFLPVQALGLPSPPRCCISVTFGIGHVSRPANQNQKDRSLRKSGTDYPCISSLMAARPKALPITLLATVAEDGCPDSTVRRRNRRSLTKERNIFGPQHSPGETKDSPITIPAVIGPPPSGRPCGPCADLRHLVEFLGLIAESFTIRQRTPGISDMRKAIGTSKL